MYKHFFKRLIDIIISFIGIAVLALPMLIIAIIIKIDSKGPVLFKQKRVGIHKKHFNILKFRSMPITAPKDVPTHEFRAEDMLSPWQKFMRKCSIDELPQLFNIFAGQMSIIGPRPALWNQYDLIEERDKYGANDIKPGLTGWAQINGRDELEIEHKARLDGEYVRRQSLFFDIRCFFGTIASVLRSDGVVEGGTGELHRRDGETLEEATSNTEQTASTTASEDSRSLTAAAEEIIATSEEDNEAVSALGDSI